MLLEVVVMKEWKDRPYRSKQGVEIQPHVFTCMETGPEAMVQLMDYVLQPDDLVMFGQTHGKRLRLRVNSIRNIFSGRARLDASIVHNSDGKPAIK